MSDVQWELENRDGEDVSVFKLPNGAEIQRNQDDGTEEDRVYYAFDVDSNYLGWSSSFKTAREAAEKGFLLDPGIAPVPSMESLWNAAVDSVDRGMESPAGDQVLPIDHDFYLVVVFPENERPRVRVVNAVKLDDRYEQAQNDLSSFWELRFIPAEKLHRF